MIFGFRFFIMMTGGRTGDIAGELAGSPIASCRSCISCLVLDQTHMEFWLGISGRMRWSGMEFSMRAPTTNISSTLLQWDRLRLYLTLRFWAAPACRCAKNGKSAPGSWRLFWRCSAMEHRQLLISTSRSRRRLCGRCWRLGLHSQERKQNRQNSSNRQNGLNRQQIRADSAEKPKWRTLSISNLKYCVHSNPCRNLRSIDSFIFLKIGL